MAYVIEDGSLVMAVCMTEYLEDPPSSFSGNDAGCLGSSKCGAKDWTILESH